MLSRQISRLEKDFVAEGDGNGSGSGEHAKACTTYVGRVLGAPAFERVRGRSAGILAGMGTGAGTGSTH